MKSGFEQHECGIESQEGEQSAGYIPCVNKRLAAIRGRLTWSDLAEVKQVK